MKHKVQISLAFTFFVIFSFSPVFAEYRPGATEISRMSKLLPEIGEIQGKDLTATRIIRVGAPYEPGVVAYFFRYVDGNPAWVFEEWKNLSADKFQLTYWHFFFDNKTGIYTRVTTGQSILDGRIAHDIYYEVFVEITASTKAAKIASDKSERAWQIFRQIKNTDK